METTRIFFTVILISVAIGLVLTITMNGCICKDCGGPALISPPIDFLTTVLLVISDPAHIQKTDTLIWSEMPVQSFPDTLNSFVTLQRNYVYNMQIIILDSTKCDTCNGFVVSNEIIARQNYNLFCFYDFDNQNDIYGTNQSSRAGSGWANVTVTDPNLDSGTPPLPFGITDSLRTYGPTQGQLEVILRHQPAVKNGQCSPGSTTLDVYYNIMVQ